MAKDNTQAPQTLIYNRQGTIHEAWEDGSFIWLVDTQYSARNMRTLMGNLLGYQEFNNSGAVTLSDNGATAGPTIGSEVGMVIVSLDVDTVISGSLYLSAPYSGQMVTIMQRGAVDANTAAWMLVFSAGTSGGIMSDVKVIQDSEVVSLSCINFLASASQQPWITLISPNGDEWAVLHYGTREILLDNAPRENAITMYPDA